MNEIVKEIKQMGGFFEALEIREFSIDIELWKLNNINSSLAKKIVTKYHTDVSNSGGLIFLFNRYAPTISINDLDSADKIDDVLAEEYTADVLYCHDIKVETNSLIEIAYLLAGIKCSYGVHHDNVIGFLSKLLTVCTLIPFQIDTSFLMAKLSNIKDMSALDKIIDREYIPLLSMLGRLDEPSGFIKNEVMRNMLIWI